MIYNEKVANLVETHWNGWTLNLARVVTFFLIILAFALETFHFFTSEPSFWQLLCISFFTILLYNFRRADWFSGQTSIKGILSSWNLSNEEEYTLLTCLTLEKAYKMTTEWVHSTYAMTFYPKGKKDWEIKEWKYHFQLLKFRSSLESISVLWNSWLK